MRIVRWIASELRFRRTGALVAVLGVTTATGSAVALALLESGFERETRRIVRDIGFNIRIIPRAADLDQFYVDDYATETMSEETIHRLAGVKSLSYNHLVATLTQRIELGSKPAYLLGVSPTYFPKGQKKKSPMMFAVKPGEAHLGSRVAESAGAERGGVVMIRGEEFRIARVLPKTSKRDDLTVYVNLADAQRLLALENRINEIKAIDCLCLTSDLDPAARLASEIESVIPETQVFHLSTIADARARQRQTVVNLAAVLVPMTSLAACLVVAVLAFINVRERRSEIGVLRALGYGGGHVLSLFLGKAAILGVAGGTIGFAAGTGFALAYGPVLFELTAHAMKADGSLLGWSVGLACLFAVIASSVPALVASRQDPSQNLAPQ